MGVLSNYVELPPNTPVRLRLKNPRIEERQIRDPKTGIVKTVRALVFDVYEKDGVPGSWIFSTLSEKLATQLMALWQTGILQNHAVEIVRIPRDFATEYEVRVI